MLKDKSDSLIKQVTVSDQSLYVMGKLVGPLT